MPTPRKPKAAAGKAAQPAPKAKASRVKPGNEVKVQQGAVAAKIKKAGKPEEKLPAKKAKAGKAKPEKAKPAAPTKSEPAKLKPKKAKLVRDSFTMPENEYQAIADIKKACIGAGFEIKKSELLRIGVALLQKMAPAQIQEALSGLPALKAGRPKKSGGDTPAVQ